MSTNICDSLKSLSSDFSELSKKIAADERQIKFYEKNFASEQNEKNKLLSENVRLQNEMNTVKDNQLKDHKTLYDETIKCNAEKEKQNELKAEALRKENNLKEETLRKESNAKEEKQRIDIYKHTMDMMKEANRHQEQMLRLRVGIKSSSSQQKNTAIYEPEYPEEFEDM
jgi:hypothetical protein